MTLWGGGVTSTARARPLHPQPRSRHAPTPRRTRPVQRGSAGTGRARPRTTDSGCWDQLVALRPSVLAFLKRRCRDEHQAEDLAQETLLRAARHAGYFDHVQRPVSWVLQIAANVHLDHARKESWQHLSPPDHAVFLLIPGTEAVPGDSADLDLYRVDGQEVDGADLTAAVRAVWGTLLERDRVVLSAFYGEGGGTAAAAAACMISRQLVKVRLFRARRRLHAAVLELLGRS